MAKTDTQAAILDAVQAVIVRDGVRGASMRTVAEEAEVSVGLLSYHFEDKQSLLLAAFDRATGQLLDASVAAADREVDPEQRVRQFLRGAFTHEFLGGDYLRVRISLWAVALTDPELAALDATFYAIYCRAWADLVAAARPDVPADEIERRVVDAVAMSNGVWLDWARYKNDGHLERGLERCERLVLG